MANGIRELWLLVARSAGLPRTPADRLLQLPTPLKAVRAAEVNDIIWKNLRCPTPTTRLFKHSNHIAIA